jgi:hypothetical protein
MFFITSLIIKIPRSYYLHTSPSKETPVCRGQIKKVSLLVLSFLFFSFLVNAQLQKTEYTITFRGDSVGNMQFYKNEAGSNLYLKAVSNVRIRFLVNVNVQLEEISNFQSGRLMYSSVSRIVNGKEKSAKQTKAAGKIYESTSFGKPVPSTDKRIDYNLNMLYCKEPFDKQVIYSDNFQQFLSVEQFAPHRYKIVLPDGNYNYYTFRDGICHVAEIRHPLYTIFIRLNT